MAVNSALPPYPSFFDATGKPLENGFIYIGQPGFEARTTPKASFFDVALSVPTGTASGAAIRTRAGFPINQSRAPAMFYVDGDFSMTVTDRNGVVLYTALNNTLAVNVGGAVGSFLWADGDLGTVGGGFFNESNTGFLRPSAGVMQTAVQGTLATELSVDGLRTAVPLLRSIAPNVTAGTNVQGQAPITLDFNILTTTASNPSGVTLPPAVAGRRVTVVNRGTNRVNVYPATGAQIGALAVNLSWPLLVRTSLDFVARSATQWEPQTDGIGLLTDPGLNQSLGWNDTTNAFAWFTPARQLLAEKTASASATLDFTEFNNAIYRYYEFELDNVKPATDATTLLVRFSTDAGSSYDAGASDYAFTGIATYLSTAYVSSTGATAINLTVASDVGNAAGERGVSGSVRLRGAPDAAQTRLQAELMYDNASTILTHASLRGTRRADQDTDAVRFLFSSGNIASGTIRMYGLP